MRILPRIVGTAFLVPLAAGAQSPAASAAFRDLDTLPPRMLPVLAMRAKATDRVAAQEAEWRRWATARPASPAPRLALAQLTRLDLRYDESRAWGDSAARLATSTLWRAAARRERVASGVVRGEFVGLDSIVAVMAADTVGLPNSEKAEVLYARAGHLRRVTRRLNTAVLDSIAALSSPSDTSIHARIHCLRAAVGGAGTVPHADSAITLAVASGLLSIAANCELTIATQFANSGEMVLATRWLERAEARSRAAHDEPTLGATLQWQGYIQQSLGRVQNARRWYTQAIRVAQHATDRNVEAWSLLGIAAGARNVGDASTASSALARAATLFEATGDPIGALNARLERGQALIQLRDYDGAERLTRDMRVTADSLDSKSAALRALYQQGDIALRRGQLDRTESYLTEASAYVERMGSAWSTQLTEYRGVLAQRRGDSKRAIELLTAGRAQYSKTQDLYLANIDGTIALAWLTAGDTARAAAMLDESSRRLDAVRDTLAVEGLRKVVGSPEFWGGSNSSVDQALAAFVVSPKWLPTVFTVTERSRARSLLSGAIANESDTSLTEIATARRRVRANATVLAEVQRSLKPNTALLIYAGGNGGARTAMMLVTPTMARGFTVASLDSLDRDIVRWLALLESGETGTGAGRRVSAAVLGTALRTLPSTIRRLVVVPHGPLYRVPFQALPVGAGVLGDRVVVTIAPSVSLAMAYAVNPRVSAARVLALGAGDTQLPGGTTQTLELMVERTARGNPLTPLQSAGDEARAAAGWAPGSLALTGADASETALKREARGAYTVLHTAAHALTSDQALGANYLILRPDSLDDGYVSGGELSTLSHGMSMVVLSGCRTTGDFGSSGDAVDGLVAPLLARGVRTVLASHWAVSDRWTKVLMERFYQQLAAGENAATAMNTAQTSLRRAGVPARFWAAFSVIGDGELSFARSAVR